MEGHGKIEVPGNQAILCQVCTTKPALLVCSCLTSVLLCADCVSSHFRTAGSHNIAMLNLEKPIVTSSNVQCVLCQRKEADHICVCEGKPTPLCFRCTEKHAGTASLEGHVYISCKAFPFFNGPDYLVSLRARQIGTREGRVKLLSTLDRISAAQRQLMAHFEGLIAEVRKLQEEKMQEFRRMKEQFQAMVDSALTEAEEHIYEINYKSDNWLTSAIWNYSTQLVDLNFFSYISDDYVALRSIRQSTHFQFDLSGRVSNNEIMLPLLTKNELMRWDYRLRNFTTPVPLSTPIAVDRRSVWSETGDGGIFVCGGCDPISAAVYLINASDGTVQKLPPMKEARYGHGLIVYDNEVSVFGGWDNKNTCEFLNLREKLWTQLPNMHKPRSCCTPCRYEDRVFLAGGEGASSVECFHWRTHTFSLLKIEIPAETSVCLVHNGELIVLQTAQYYRFKLNSNETCRRRTETKRLDYCDANCPAIVCQERAYVLSADNNVVVELKLPEVEVQGSYPCIRI